MYSQDEIKFWIAGATGDAGTGVEPGVCASIARAMLAHNTLYGKNEGGYVNGNTKFFLGEELFRGTTPFKSEEDAKHYSALIEDADYDFDDSRDFSESEKKERRLKMKLRDRIIMYIVIGIAICGIAFAIIELIRLF